MEPVIVPLLLAPHPTQQAPLHQQQVRSVHSGTHRTGAPATSLQAPSHSALISDPCHCSLPPELSPVGLQDTAVPGQIRDYISQRPWRHRTASQPASPSMPESIMGEEVGLLFLSLFKNLESTVCIQAYSGVPVLERLREERLSQPIKIKGPVPSSEAEGRWSCYPNRKK